MATVSSGERAAQARSVHRALGTENFGGGIELSSRTEGGEGDSAASFYKARGALGGERSGD